MKNGAAGILRILIVEDNLEFRGFLKGMIYQRYDRTVVAEAQDAAEGLRLHASFKPHLAFIDISLSGEVNGLQLTEQLRITDSTVRIAIITNHDLPEYRNAAVQLGADSFFSKSALSPMIIQAVMDQTLAATPPR